jgi:hypothetical protein
MIIDSSLEELVKVFDKQLNNDNSIVSESVLQKLKSLKCFGRCPDIKIGDRVLYFFVGNISVNGKSIKKKLQKGNIVSAYKAVGEHDMKIDLCRITQEYLSDPNCELLKLKIDKSIKLESMLPRFFEIKQK